MLAQGEFTRFLNSKDNEKAEILEMITGADIYTKIGAAIFVKAKAKQEAFEAADAAVQGIKLLTDDEKEGKSNEIAARKNEMMQAGLFRDKCKSKADWLDTEEALSDKQAKAQTALAEARATVSTEEFLAGQKLVDSWKETQEVRHELGTAKAEEEKADRARNSIISNENLFQRVRSGMAFLKNKEEELRMELAGKVEFLDKEKNDLPAIQKVQAIEGYLNTIESANNEIENLKREIETIEKKLADEFGPAKDKAADALKIARQAKESAEKALQEAEDILAKADLQKVRDEIQAILIEKGHINLAIERIQAFDNAYVAREKEKGEIETAEKDLEGKKTIRNAETTNVNDLRSEMLEVEARYQARKDSVEEVVGDIRNRLKIGDVCPVCMREITSVLPSDEEVRARLAPFEKTFTEAKSKYEKAKSDLDSLDAAISFSEKTLIDRKQKFDEDKAVENAKKSALEALKECGFEVLSDKSKEALENMLEASGNKLKDLKNKEAKGKVLEKNVENARIADKTAGNALAEASNVLAKAEKTFNETKALKTNKISLAESRGTDITKAIEALDTILKGTRWEDCWYDRAGEFRQEITDSLKAHNDAVQRQSDLNVEIQEIVRQNKVVGGNVIEIEAMIPEWKNLDTKPASELPELEKVSGKLKQDINLAKGLKEEARQAADSAMAKVQMFLRVNDSYTQESLIQLSECPKEKIKLIEDQQNELKIALQNAEAALNAIKSQYSDHTAKRPALSETDTKESLKAESDAYDKLALKLAGEISLLEAELQNDAQNASKLGDLSAKAEAAKAERDKWARLNSLIGDSTGSAFRKIAQSYVLGSLVGAANNYMKDLTDRYVLTVVPGTFIITLEDAYQGYASRPASTISGGESFLVSLSLALALSDIGDSLSVDTLFIDEGFGTLSGDPLRNAVNTLKALHTKAGRHVGIISHIEELKPQIPVRIQVEQDARTATSTVKVVPEEE